MSTLRTDIWAAALIRRAQVGGAFAAVVARGDPDAGAVLVKINLLDGRAWLRAPMLDINGERVWIDPLGGDGPAPEAEADAYAKRRREADRDLWVIEIEDRHGRDFLE